MFSLVRGFFSSGNGQDETEAAHDCLRQESWEVVERVSVADSCLAGSEGTHVARHSSTSSDEWNHVIAEDETVPAVASAPKETSRKSFAQVIQHPIKDQDPVARQASASREESLRKPSPPPHQKVCLLFP
jgi:hypothetical protein